MAETKDFKDILKYCYSLGVNNNRTWFHDHHDEYEKAKKDFQGFLDMLRFAICQIFLEVLIPHIPHHIIDRVYAHLHSCVTLPQQLDRILFNHATHPCFFGKMDLVYPL